MNITNEEMIKAFTLWDTEYREHPDEFQSTVDHLLNSTPEEYGDNATICFKAYLEKIRKAESK